MKIIKKIIVDIDVVTVAKWDRGKNGDLGRSMLLRIERRGLEMITPYIILELISEWKYVKLSKQIKEFYEFYSTKIISVINLEDKINQLRVDRKALTADLKLHVIKEEDIILVIITSIFDADYLVTFNRKHLKNKEEVINNVLEKYGLKTIKIALPNEI